MLLLHPARSAIPVQGDRSQLGRQSMEIENSLPFEWADGGWNGHFCYCNDSIRLIVTTVDSADNERPRFLN